MGYRLLDTWTGEHIDVKNPDSGTGSYTEFDNREDAFQTRPKHWPRGRAIVCFVLTASEFAAWDRRMRNRFTDRTYRRIPDLNWTLLAENLHYPHMSNKQPGNVAYTPSEEFGHLDRQVSTTPGRYLEKFYPKDYTQAECERFIAQCQQMAEERQLKFAVTADDIESVYTTPGPSSCMAHPVEDFQTDVHPVRVYGDSDLQVAYIGTLGKKISARAVVWPERKTYVRTYGANSLIEAELARLGYEHTTDFDGAHVRIIEDDRGVVMPYIDGCGSASISRTRQGFVCLGRGGISTSGTDGRGTDERESWRSCDRCDSEYDTEDDDATSDYCASCAESRVECSNCDRNMFTDDSDCYEYGDAYVCQRCHREHGNECSHCSETWYAFEFSTRERQARQNANQDGMCADCVSDGWIECAECGSTCQPDDDTLMCSECADTSEEPVTPPTPRCEHTSDLFESHLALCNLLDIKPNMTYTLVRVVTSHTEATVSLFKCYLTDAGPAQRIGSAEGLFEKMGSLKALYPNEQYAVVESMIQLAEKTYLPDNSLGIA